MSAHFTFAGLHLVQEEWGDGNEEFALFANVRVQEHDQPAREVFEVQIVSPSYLTWMLTDGQEEILLGRGLILLAEYDEALIEDTLRGLIECEGIDSWDALRAQVEKYFDWTAEE